MNESISPESIGSKGYIAGRYGLRLLTPAFVGDADQQGRWRTPPIKALLRQWWRVVWAAEHGFPDDFQRMRHEEGLLFGHAWLADDRDRAGKKVKGRRSLVRIRLEAPDRDQAAWTEGGQRGVAPLADGLNTSYAWFGLLDSKTKAPLRSGIKPGDAEGRRVLQLAWPEDEDHRMRLAIRLIRDFGQLGYRSRGGWGALHIDDVDSVNPDELARFTRPLEDCLSGGWAASMAADADGLMIWQGRQTFDNWAKLMESVARQRKDVRDALKSAGGADLRAVLGTAKNSDRIANPLRWRPVLDTGGHLRLRIFAMPWRISSHLQTIPDRQLASAWRAIARKLDQHGDLERCGT